MKNKYNKHNKLKKCKKEVLIKSHKKAMWELIQKHHREMNKQLAITELFLDIKNHFLEPLTNKMMEEARFLTKDIPVISVVGKNVEQVCAELVEMKKQYKIPPYE